LENKSHVVRWDLRQFVEQIVLIVTKVNQIILQLLRLLGGVISSSQTAATSETVKHFSSRVVYVLDIALLGRLSKYAVRVYTNTDSAEL